LEPVPPAYLEDASGLKGRAEAVFRPRTAEEAGSLLAEASRTRTPITVAGAGTGVTGGCVPEGGWVLSTERFDRLEIGSGRARVGAGVLLRSLQAAAKTSSQFYAPDPTEWSASIGGNIATNASGSRSFLYGSTRQHLLAATVAWMDGSVRTFLAGEKINFPYMSFPEPQSRKHTAGYCLRENGGYLQLLCGSEGTLGVVLEAEVALLPLPAELLTGVVFFRSDSDALDAADCWRDAPGLRMLEFLDRPSLGLLRGAYPQIPNLAASALFVEQITEGNYGDAEVAEDAWLGRLEAADAIEDSWFGVTEADRERFRAFRHKLPEIVNDRVRRNGFQKMSTDLAVPVAKNREMMRWYQERLESEFPGKFVIFGHIGDAHVHVNILPETEQDARRGVEFLEAAARQSVALRGTVSAEHGLGKKKAHFLPLEFSPAQIEAMCAVKRRFDPHWLLGRGTLLPLPPELR
jgi:FAD/FMN-containing dehydrogenase